MTPDAFRRLALSLPDAHEEPHFARTSYRVGKKIFATMTRDGEEAMVRVAAPEKLEALLAGHPERFFSHGGWTTRNGAIGVRLARVPLRQLRPLLVDSWRRVATQEAVAAWDRRRRPAR